MFVEINLTGSGSRLNLLPGEYYTASEITNIKSSSHHRYSSTSNSDIKCL